MVAAVDGFTITEAMPNDNGIVELWVQTLNTVDENDTIAITLPDYGISATGLLSVESWWHTTDGSIIVTRANTCAVVAGVLTITIIGAGDNDTQVMRVVGRSIPNKFDP